MRHILIAGLMAGGLLLPSSVCARAVIEASGSEINLFDDERMVPWEEMDQQEFAQQTPSTAPSTNSSTTTPAVTPPAAPLTNSTTTTPAITLPVTPVPAQTEPVKTPDAAPTPVTPDTKAGDAAEPLPDTTEEAEPTTPTQEGAVEDDFSIGDIPVVETLELTAEKARKALDAYVLVREKYKDAALEDFENLQDFVEQSPVGKTFEADIKAAGFADVTEWNTTITTLSFAYDNSVDDQTAEITQQITELKADTEMAQDMRERMITALNAMIPSDNNKVILDGLKADPAYAEKLKLLETEAE